MISAKLCALALATALVGAPGCADQTSGLAGNGDAGAHDAGAHEVDAAFCEAPVDLGRSGLGMWSTHFSGCLDCLCAPSEDGGPTLECEMQACPGPPPGVAADYPRCTQQADCAPTEDPLHDVCIFNAGCEAPAGYCMRGQSRCPRAPVEPATAEDEVSFCGCDGVTYRGNCPLVPYRHAGRCAP